MVTDSPVSSPREVLVLPTVTALESKVKYPL